MNKYKVKQDLQLLRSVLVKFDLARQNLEIVYHDTEGFSDIDKYVRSLCLPGEIHWSKIVEWMKKTHRVGNLIEYVDQLIEERLFWD